MGKAKRVLALVLSMAMGIMMISGCGTGKAASSSESDTSSSDKNYSDIKVGLVLTGSSKDGGWSQLAADALANAQKDYGCKTDFSENVATTDIEPTISGYADAGYNIVIAHGAEFLDTCKTVAATYPNTIFICTSAMSGKAPNVAGIDFDGYTGGFLVGTALALATESNKIGVVEASEEGASAEWLRGVKEGSAYINKDCQVLSMNTGSWDDASKAKQAVDSLESQGVDAVTENCDAAGAGAVEECDALGLINVGWNNDYSQYGKSCMISFRQDITLGAEVAIKNAMDGKLKGQDNVIEIGAADGVIKVTDYAGTYANSLSDEKKAKLKEMYDMACGGKNLDDLN